MKKPSAIAGEPFITIKMKTIKEKSYYTQGQQRIARILLAAWMPAIGSPEGGGCSNPKISLLTLTRACAHHTDRCRAFKIAYLYYKSFIIISKSLNSSSHCVCYFLCLALRDIL